MLASDGARVWTQVSLSPEHLFLATLHSYSGNSSLGSSPKLEEGLNSPPQVPMYPDGRHWASESAPWVGSPSLLTFVLSIGLLQLWEEKEAQGLLGTWP